MSLCNLLRAISILTLVDAIQHLPAHCKRPGIAAIDHCARSDCSTRPDVGEPAEIDIVEYSRSVKTKRIVKKQLEVLGLAMFGPHARGHCQHFVSGARRNQDLDAHQICGAAFSSVFSNSLLRGDHGRLLQQQTL
ncbi:hypothetical protein [Bradyrhizobium genosp. A]|uniref:hypothetical protein n=1 Tax=Bradyrhizobium genosp. A TaxID=83626 RepID=UPI003CF7BDC0